MKFYKYQAIGNDFVITEQSSLSAEKALKICDRHFGIGADGVLFHFKSENADAGMKIFNSDGSVAEMCGNGLRCFAAYLVNDCGITRNPILVETGRGILAVKWEKGTDGKITVEANLGIPVSMNTPEQIEFEGNKLQTFGISMGNPHIVVFPAKKIEPGTIYKTAHYFQQNNIFGKEVNVEILTDINKKQKSAFIIVKERGAGYTLGCGTGGAAVIYALYLQGLVKNEAWKIFFPGGEAEYRIEKSGEILMTGTPVKIFSGEFNLKGW